MNNCYMLPQIVFSFKYFIENLTFKRFPPEEKTYDCRYCDQKFSQSQSTKRHEMTHTGEKPYDCRYYDQNLQSYYFSPVWVLSCIFELWDWENLWSQYLQSYGFSSVWVLSCIFKFVISKERTHVIAELNQHVTSVHEGRKTIQM